MDNYLIPVIPFHKQIISKGKGAYIFDENGKKYLDLNCGQFCTIFGHFNPELEKCVTSILLSTGAEAVEFAIRYAKHMTGKDGLVCFEKGYHGLTLGTQSITFGGRYAAPFVNHIFSIPIPNGTDDINGIDVLKRIIAEHKEVCAKNKITMTHYSSHQNDPFA